MTAVSAGLQAVDVVKEFGSRSHRHRALAGVSLSVPAGRRIGIVGESGSGKSTLSRILVGLETATSGTVEYQGNGVTGLLASPAGRIAFRRDVQYISQDTSSSFDPRRKLIDSVTAPLANLKNIRGDEARAIALETMRRMELDPALAERYPKQVSGGQRQRFAIARGLVVEPKVLLCDEVVSALDVSVQGSILNLLKRYCLDTGAGMLFVSHGLPATAFITDEIVVMNQGRIVERGQSQDVLTSPKDEYTAALVEAYHGSAA
jgi:ABC-type dipeptide/oligopeptide/nickel transport system ATPase subunit